MESRNRIQPGLPDKEVSVFSSIFSFDELDKVTLLNLIQYVTLSIIPILLVLKVLHEYVPEEDEEKSSIEVTAELIIEVVGIVLALWFINKAIVHIPTYSGKGYPAVSIFSGMLPLVFILMTIQSKFSKKVNILFDRVYSKEQKPIEQKNQPVQPLMVAPPITVQTKMEDNRPMNPHQPPEQPAYNRVQQMNEPMASNETFGEYSSW
jgi:hypothetical protein